MNTCLILVLIAQSLYVSSSLTIVRPTFCSLEKVTGPCRAYIPSYYYDESAGSCLKFIYGGCRGNKNRFSTLEDCEKQCHPENKCDRPCPMIYAPVCGSDGKTYASECVLDVASCKSGGKIKKDYQGQCEPKCDRPCPMIYAPLCGSDGKTYASQCTLDVASCENGGTIKKDHEGECKPKCSRICPMNYDPQCGSDGKTYSNTCALKFATCQSNGKITLASQGECVCSLDKEPGFCRGYFPRFFYNSKSQACEQFIYGGCGGNKNNFETLEACQNKCH